MQGKREVMSYSGSEKRRYKRITQHFIIQFRIKEPGEIGLKDGLYPGWNMVTSQDLGAGGVLFNFDKKIEVGTILYLKINFPKIEKPIECTGKVIRIEESNYAPIFRIAVIFTDIGEKEKETIEKAAEEFYFKKDNR